MLLSEKGIGSKKGLCFGRGQRTPQKYKAFWD